MTLTDLFRPVPLVPTDPQQPGRFVLAIECDGASYHSAPTARDRDRLRQQQLEALGWRFCRIWSTDWFNERDKEAARVVEAYERALASEHELEAERDTASNAPEPSAEPPSSGDGPSGTLPVSLPPMTHRRSIAQYSFSELKSLATVLLRQQILRVCQTTSDLSGFGVAG